MRYWLTATCISSVLLSGCGGISQEDKALITKECKKFVEQTMGEGGRQRRIIETEVFDVWKKNDSYVADVGCREKGEGESFSVRYCVVHPDQGRISLPSVFDQSEWKK